MSKIVVFLVDLGASLVEFTEEISLRQVVSLA